MGPKDANGMANSVDPDLGAVWIYNVCQNLPVRKLKIIMVFVERDGSEKMEVLSHLFSF